jgi:hypothetical protein
MALESNLTMLSFNCKNTTQQILHISVKNVFSPIYFVPIFFDIFVNFVPIFLCENISQNCNTGPRNLLYEHECDNVTAFLAPRLGFPPGRMSGRAARSNDWTMKKSEA